MSLPVEIVFGISSASSPGSFPRWWPGYGFVFKYVTDVTIPGLGVVVVARARDRRYQRGLLALNDETIRSSERAPAILTAIIVVLMISLYAHAQGTDSAPASRSGSRSNSSGTEPSRPT